MNNKVYESKFITGDGTVIYIGTPSQLELAKKIGWREATDEEAQLYFGRIAERNKEEAELFRPIVDLIEKANAKSL